MKSCSVCGALKPFDSFCRDRSRPDGRHHRCRVCRSTKYQGQKEEISLKSKEYNRNNTQHRKERSARYYKENKEAFRERYKRWYALNAKTYAEHTKAYRKSRPGYGASLRAKRRATERRATPIWADLAKMTAIYVECAEMSRRSGYPFHVDHIVPLNSPLVCGLHCEQNLICLPAWANLEKGNSVWPDMWEGFDD